MMFNASLMGVRKKGIPSEELIQDLVMMTPGFASERIYSFTHQSTFSSKTAQATMHDC
jgi:hypothetical protein